MNFFLWSRGVHINEVRLYVHPSDLISGCIIIKSTSGLQEGEFPTGKYRWPTYAYVFPTHWLPQVQCVSSRGSAAVLSDWTGGGPSDSTHT